MRTLEDLLRHAAAVLALWGDRVLGFYRYDREGIGLPCGFVNPGETPLQTAIRECAEETGHVVELVPGGPGAFTSFDSMGGNLTTTFLVRTVSKHWPSTPDEGKEVWVSPRVLSEGPYGNYNERMFRHFGINPWPLVGKFHSHITLRASPEELRKAAALVGGKVTYINLTRGDDLSRAQTDAMITSHYVTGHRGLEDEHDVLFLLKKKAHELKALGYDVQRVKLEYELYGKGSPRADVERALMRLPYTEVHIKLLISSEGTRESLRLETAKMGWHPSTNPFSKTDDGKIVQFINRRFYGGSKLEEIEPLIDKIFILAASRGADILEVKHETAIYDSNDDLDRWWMT